MEKQENFGYNGFKRKVIEDIRKCKLKALR